MRKLISTFILLALYSVSLNAFSANSKQVLCHDGKEIFVSQSAISSHMGHGDTWGSCDGASIEPEPGTIAAVVMMRCEAKTGNGVEVVSFSASFDLVTILPVQPVDCAVALAELFDAGFHLRSVSSGSAEAGGSLHLYTDYLLIGRISEDS